MMPVYDDEIKHVRLTAEEFTHWSSGLGNLTFDPSCPRCWMDEWASLQQRVEALSRKCPRPDEHGDIDVSAMMVFCEEVIALAAAQDKEQG